MNQTIAVIADVHGNTWALDAVLDDIRRRGIERIVNLGDCVYGSLDPAGTAERLMDPKIISIAGNQDRDVFAPTPTSLRASGAYSRDEPQPKFGPATSRSPGRTVAANSGRASTNGYLRRSSSFFSIYGA